jgi:hypothetical protein
MSPGTISLPGECFTHIWQERLQCVVSSTNSFEGYWRMAGDTLSAASKAEEIDLLYVSFPVFTIPPPGKDFCPPEQPNRPLKNYSG